MAIGELFGAAAFITAVVIGSVSLVRPFEVVPGSFRRDVVSFIAAASFTLWSISDGVLEL